MVLQHTCSTNQIYDLVLQHAAGHKFVIQLHNSTTKDFESHMFHKSSSFAQTLSTSLNLSENHHADTHLFKYTFNPTILSSVNRKSVVMFGSVEV